MKRVTLFAGHYGSGKTNIALAWARHLRKGGNRVTIADLDIVNPYFRTKDSREELAKDGIELVVSEYANSNVDFPALPREIYAAVADEGAKLVIDVGGDDRGALALGRYAGDILAENDYDMLAVVNASRPLTRTVEATIEVLREIEVSSSGLRFTGIVNNTNLGPETTAATIIDSVDYAKEIAQKMGLEVRFTACDQHLATELQGKIEIFPMKLQQLYYQIPTTAQAANMV